MKVGGNPARFSTRAGTAPAGVFDEPAGTPSSEVQPKTLDSAVQTNSPRCDGTERLLPVRSSNIG